MTNKFWTIFCLFAAAICGLTYYETSVTLTLFGAGINLGLAHSFYSDGLTQSLLGAHRNYQASLEHSVRLKDALIQKQGELIDVLKGDGFTGRL